MKLLNVVICDLEKHLQFLDLKDLFKQRVIHECILLNLFMRLLLLVVLVVKGESDRLGLPDQFPLY